MIGIVIVSHSAKLAEGVKELAGQMAGDQVRMSAAGGTADGSLGTDAEQVRAAIEEVATADGVLVLVDLGSAVMSAQVAMEMLDPELVARVRLSNAPLVEGAVVAGVEASLGKSLDEVDAAARGAAGMRKVE
jgi:dihydroxyacetone kinase phosphotransfer subunit